jgi:hypothetical protein
MIRRALLSLSIIMPALAGEPEGVEARVGPLALRHPASWTASVGTISTVEKGGADWAVLTLKTPRPDVTVVVQGFISTKSAATAPRTAGDMLWLLLKTPQDALPPAVLAGPTISFDRIETGDGPAPAARIIVPARDGKPPESWHGFTCVGGSAVIRTRAWTPVPGTIVNARVPEEGPDAPSGEYLRALDEAYAIVRTVAISR